VDGAKQQRNYAFANGYGGQFIVVFPDLNLVVTATNEWNNINTSGANNNWTQTLDLIMNQVVAEFEK
jgi:CubicO group peptidase (beta-lactamase class C family)